MEMVYRVTNSLRKLLTYIYTHYRYAMTTALSSRVGHLNPSWNEPSTDEDAMKRFVGAMEMVGSEFKDRVSYYSTAWWPARKLVEEALAKRTEVRSGRDGLGLVYYNNMLR